MTIESVALIAQNVTRWRALKELVRAPREFDRARPLFGVRVYHREQEGKFQPIVSATADSLKKWRSTFMRSPADG
jgi:hypothetical protein